MQDWRFQKWYIALALDADKHGFSILIPTYRFWRVVYQHGAPPTIYGVLAWAEGYTPRFRDQLNAKLQVDSDRVERLAA